MSPRTFRQRDGRTVATEAGHSDSLFWHILLKPSHFNPLPCVYAEELPQTVTFSGIIVACAMISSTFLWYWHLSRIEPRIIEPRTNKMAWRPLHTNHAIERVKLAIQFSESIPAKVSKQMSEAIGMKRHDLRMTGPTPVQTIDLQFTPGMSAPVAQPASTGWQFTRAAGNGLPLEAVLCDGTLLSYETSEYQRWDVFKRRLSKVLDEPVARAAVSLDLASVVLEYTDRFIFDGAAEQADVEDLLNGMTAVLPEAALQGRSLWHLHKGWFESEDGGEVLINQNFDAQDGSVPGRSDPIRSIQILNRSELRQHMFPLNIEQLAEHLEVLHNSTKSLFTRALAAKYHSSVGIG